MTDKKGTVVWQADYRPFGETVVDEDPDGDGKKVILNLRFPGQYFDKETGLHYNYHRYYHPDIGRYLRPDPFGIDMFASNLFVYVNGNPIGKIDPFGLLIIDGLDCTEIARRIIPGLISGTPFDSYYYGRAVICVDIVIEDPLTCVCVGVLNDVYIDLYRNFVSYEVVYRCYPKGECGIDDFKIVTRIESEEGAPIERRRYVPRPELGKVTKLGTPIRYPSRNCSACPNGVGKPM
jgi:RHS repeat-associated protein